VLLDNTKTPIRPHLLLQSSKGVYAIRKGPWKLIATAGGIKGKGGKRRKSPEDPGHPQLFNLEYDLGETRDVSKDHPELVRELTGILDGDRARGHSRE
jgi:arylsulfatase A